MRKVTFDIETIGEFGSNGDFSKLEISVVGIHDSETNEYRAFVREEFAELWQILERTDLLIGYNSDHFDIPILNKYYAGDLTKIKSLDLLKEIKSVLGRRLRLDSVAQGTLGRGKIGHGNDAVTWWAEGKYEKVKEYCLDDVKLTKEVYDYARKNNALKYMDYEGPREIKLDASKWEDFGDSASMTHTLPF